MRVIAGGIFLVSMFGGLFAITPPARAEESVPPITGVYFCYQYTRVYVSTPFIVLPTSPPLPTPTGVYTNNPPC